MGPRYRIAATAARVRGPSAPFTRQTSAKSNSFSSPEPPWPAPRPDVLHQSLDLHSLDSRLPHRRRSYKHPFQGPGPYRERTMLITSCARNLVLHPKYIAGCSRAILEAASELCWKQGSTRCRQTFQPVLSAGRHRRWKTSVPRSIREA